MRDSSKGVQECSGSTLLLAQMPIQVLCVKRDSRAHDHQNWSVIMTSALWTLRGHQDNCSGGVRTCLLSLATTSFERIHDLLLRTTKYSHRVLPTPCFRRCRGSTLRLFGRIPRMVLRRLTSLNFQENSELMPSRGSPSKLDLSMLLSRYCELWAHNQNKCARKCSVCPWSLRSVVLVHCKVVRRKVFRESSSDARLFSQKKPMSQCSRILI